MVPDDSNSCENQAELLKSGVRVLVVDDDDSDLHAVRRCLHRADIVVTLDEATSGAEALQRLASTRYHCVLLDYYLPDANELSLVRSIQAAAPDLPVVMFTGRGDEDIAVELMKAGVADYIPKASLTPERLAAGLRHALALSRARTARYRAEAELRSAVAQAEAATAAKSRFLAATSHDLRQPLQILVSSQDILDMETIGPRGRDALQRAVRATQRIIRALDKMVEISKLESGALVPRRQAFPIQRLLSGIEDGYGRLAREKGLRLEVERCEEWVDSDPDMLSSILENLVGNAIKYTDRGEVALRCHRHDETLTVEVCDTGIGIPAEKLDLIFREYERLDPEKSEGIGLGLAIAARSAELLGHRVSVDSTPGAGSCFRIELPIGQCPPVTAAK